MNLEELEERIENMPRLERAYYWLLRKIDDIRMIPKEIKWFLQRQVRGFSDDDLWYLWHPLGKHIVKCLKAFKKMNRMGVPTEFLYDKNGKQIRSLKEGDKLFNKTIQEVIDGFEYLANHDDEEMKIFDLYQAKKITRKEWLKRTQKQMREAKEKAKKLIDIFLNLWD